MLWQTATLLELLSYLCRHHQDHRLVTAMAESLKQRNTCSLLLAQLVHIFLSGCRLFAYTNRCNYRHCYDYTGSLHNAKAQSHIPRSCAARQKPSAPWPSTSAPTQVRHGQQATVRGRVRVCKEELGESSSTSRSLISVRFASETDAFTTSRSK